MEVINGNGAHIIQPDGTKIPIKDVQHAPDPLEGTELKDVKLKLGNGYMDFESKKKFFYMMKGRRPTIREQIEMSFIDRQEREQRGDT